MFFPFILVFYYLTIIMKMVDELKISLVHLCQAEFHRLSLGFKCDMFTLEKRLRLEERSRDLAEENVRKEVTSCQGLLQVCVGSHAYFFFFKKRCPLFN